MQYGNNFPFGDVPIDERWRPAEYETDPLIRQLWDGMCEKQQSEHAWDVFRKINTRCNKSQFDFKP